MSYGWQKRKKERSSNKNGHFCLKITQLNEKLGQLRGYFHNTHAGEPHLSKSWTVLQVLHTPLLYLTYRLPFFYITPIPTYVRTKCYCTLWYVNELFVYTVMHTWPVGCNQSPHVDNYTLSNNKFGLVLQFFPSSSEKLKSYKELTFKTWRNKACSWGVALQLWLTDW